MPYSLEVSNSLSGYPFVVFFWRRMKQFIHPLFEILSHILNFWIYFCPNIVFGLLVSKLFLEHRCGEAKAVLLFSCRIFGTALCVSSSWTILKIKYIIIRWWLQNFNTTTYFKYMGTWGNATLCVHSDGTFIVDLTHMPVVVFRFCSHHLIIMYNTFRISCKNIQHTMLCWKFDQ